MTCRTASALFVSLVLGVASVKAQTPTAPAIPKTPAGNVPRAWLDAYYSGDSTLIDTYLRTYWPDRSVHDVLNLRKMSGGFDLLTIESSEPRHCHQVVAPDVGLAAAGRVGPCAKAS